MSDLVTSGFVPTLRTLAIAAIGGVVAYVLSFPAPFLTGPTIAVIAASLAGLNLMIPARLRDACFVAIGLSIGSGVTPEVYATAVRWPISFAVLILVLLVIIGVGTAIMTRFWGRDRTTGALSAMPGHLSYVLGLALEAQRDVKWVGVVQSTRVGALTLIVPFAIVLLDLEPGPAVAPAGTTPLVALAISVVLALVVGLALRRLRMPAAFLLGGMAVSTVGHLGGWVEGAVPAWLAWPSFAVMGAIIGTRFSGVSLAELRSSLGAGLAVTAAAFAISGAAALVVARLLDLPPALVLVAFAPGGLEAMAAMAITLGVDPTYVAAHHVFRLFALTVIAPLALRRTTSAKPDDPGHTEHRPDKGKGLR